MDHEKASKMLSLKSEEPRKLYNFEIQSFGREQRLQEISKLFGKSTAKSLDMCMEITLNLKKEGLRVPSGALMDIVGRDYIAKFLERD